MSFLSEIQREFELECAAAVNLTQLQELQVKFTGKKGIISKALSSLSSLPIEERKATGERANSLKNYVEKALAERRNTLEAEIMEHRLLTESLDITLPGRHHKRGRRHPITQTISDIKEIFARMGFSHICDVEIEDDWHNFSALNIPQTHPARQMHDTFYLADVDKLLRTHTSSVQVRYMEKHSPPIRVISTGRVYRADHDATHTPMFHQVEVLCIEERANFGHMKSCIHRFLQNFFNLEEIPMRMRPSYFPFTEPSAEVDIKCNRSDRNEIKLGKGADWLEILGCGMVHETVLRNVGIDPAVYRGFAFGMGVERLAMLKYNIPDLRLFFEGDMRWNNYYGF